MDDYENKSLEQLRDIAKAKYNLAIPENFQLGEAIEWLQMQDAIVDTRINAGLKGKLVVPSPVSPKVGVNKTTVILPTIPTIPGGQDLPKGTEDVPVIAPVVPTTMPTIPRIPNIPILTGIKLPPVAPRKFFLNDEGTLRTLHGNPALTWQTDLGTMYDIRNQQGVEPINPDAVFQEKVLHPDYRRPIVPNTPLTPFTGLEQPIVPGIGVNTPLPVIPGLATQLHVVPEINKLPIIPGLATQQPEINTLPVIPGLATQQQAINTLPVIPGLATQQQAINTLPVIPGLATQQVPKPTSPAIPKLTTPVVPKLTAPVVPKPVPVVTIPTTPIVPVPKPTTPVVPKLTTPVVPKPVPVVTTPAIPKLTTPVVPKPTTPIVPHLNVQQPKFPPTVPTVPTVPRPPVKIQQIAPQVPKIPTVINVPKQVTLTVLPGIPKPTVPIIPQTTAVLKPQVPTQGMTLNVNPIIPVTTTTKPKVPTPAGPLTPKAPIIPQNPVSPGFQVGATVGGFTTIKATTLNPTIPTILIGKQGIPPAFITHTNAGIPTVKMPTFNTAVSPVVTTTIKRPAPITEATQQALKFRPIPGTDDDIMAVLNEIDPELLVSGRTGKNKKGYRSEILQNFVRRLGLAVSGKRKAELIDDIKAVRREKGLS